jgi:RNA polymerase sigma-70 factor (ECF subfamily)
MNPKCRQVFELSRFQQLSYKEIANEMNIKISTVETHIVTALKIFREELKDYLAMFSFFMITLF